MQDFCAHRSVPSKPQTTPMATGRPQPPGSWCLPPAVLAGTQGTVWGPPRLLTALPQPPADHGDKRQNRAGPAALSSGGTRGSPGSSRAWRCPRARCHRVFQYGRAVVSPALTARPGPAPAAPLLEQRKEFPLLSMNTPVAKCTKKKKNVKTKLPVLTKKHYANN